MDLTEADLYTEEGQAIIKSITERYLQNINQPSLSELHAELALETTRDIFLAFIQLCQDMETM